MANRTYKITKKIRVKDSAIGTESGSREVAIGADAVNIDVNTEDGETINLLEYLELLQEQMHIVYWLDIDE